MTDYIKRIQSRLSRQGIKLEKPTLREELQILGYSNETLTSELSDLATDKLLDKFKVVQQLTVSDNLLEPIPQPSISENLVKKRGGIKETLNQQAEIPSELGQLAVAEVGSMVTSKAAELGMILTPQQVNSIADTIDISANTFDEILSDVETALLTYADYSANQVDAKIHASLTKVEERVVNRHQQSRDKLAQGLTNISTALEVSRNQTKSQLGNILSRLKVQ